MLKYSLLLFSLIPARAFAAGNMCDIFGKTCTTYEGWFSNVWNYAMSILIALSVLMLGWAGVLWMTSAGDPTKIGEAKKYIWGVVSGIALLVLANILLINILGLPGTTWNVSKP